MGLYASCGVNGNRGSTPSHGRHGPTVNAIDCIEYVGFKFTLSESGTSISSQARSNAKGRMESMNGICVQHLPAKLGNSASAFARPSHDVFPLPISFQCPTQPSSLQFWTLASLPSFSPASRGWHNLTFTHVSALQPPDE